MIKQIFALIAGIAIAAPASATSWQDINALERLVEGTGTTVDAIECEIKDVYGYYRFDKSEGVDELVICKNAVDMTDPDEVWETLAHEATHTMQACKGGPVLPDKYAPRILRELQETAPHYYRLLQRYRGDHKRIEMEAFWMELRAPSQVIGLFHKTCYTQPSNGTN